MKLKAERMKLITGGKRWAAEEKALLGAAICEYCQQKEATSSIGHPDLGYSFGRALDYLQVCNDCYVIVANENRRGRINR